MAKSNGVIKLSISLDLTTVEILPHNIEFINVKDDVRNIFINDEGILTSAGAKTVLELAERIKFQLKNETNV